MAFFKTSGVLLGAALVLFAGSLAHQDQRLFVACRASGNSADACLLQISGR